MNKRIKTEHIELPEHLLGPETAEEKSIRETNMRKDIDSLFSRVLIKGEWFSTGFEVVDSDGYFFSEHTDGGTRYAHLDDVDEVIVTFKINKEI